jgi:hypothetical protein
MKNRLTIVLWMTLLSSYLFAQPSSEKGSVPSLSKEITITIMPNPVKNNKLIVKLEGLTNQQYIIRILNNTGNVSATEKFISSTSTTFKMIELKTGFKGYGRLQLLKENGKVLAQSKFLSVD